MTRFLRQILNRWPQPETERNIMTLTPLPELLVTQLVRDALAEDWGRSGDVTSQAVIPSAAHARAVIRAREAGIVAGLDFAEAAFAASQPPSGEEYSGCQVECRTNEFSFTEG